MIVQLFPTNKKDSRIRSSKDLSKVSISRKFTTRVTCKRFIHAAMVFNDLPKEIRDIKMLKAINTAKTHIF